ncbi:MAG: hypothetical protein HN341_14635, partial [Verrucomicrobia bacterium]|nr:hypothetical protein [Verrucomicrobiota bacterium]
FENADNLGHDYQSWLLGNYRTADMWRSFSSVKSPLSFGPRFCFFRKHWGPWGYVLSGQAYLRFILIAAIRVVVPVRYLRRFYGCRSKTWKKFEFYEEDGC